ncbi:MAG: 4Fe-4S binding protein [Elusimicrobiota bacterium]
MRRELRLAAQAAAFILSVAVFFGLASAPWASQLESATRPMPGLSGARWLDLPRFWPILLLLTLLPWLGGRLYCSWYCPAGFLQDAAARLAAVMGLKGTASDGRTALRWACFGLAWTLLLCGSPSFHFLDHSSSLGSLYGLLRFSWGGREVDAMAVHGLLFGSALLVLPLWRPRWFCAALCPSGSLFTLMRRRSLFKIRSDGGCSGCGACSESCPVRCLENGRIDESRCIDCLECVPACPSGSLTYRFEPPWGKGASEPDAGRRRFLFSAGSAALAVLAGRRSPAWPLAFPPGEPRDGIPPGGRSSEEFHERCVSCGACASVCPTGVIELRGPSPLAGLGQARLAYGSKVCSYECNACLAVCPSGALAYFPLPVKKRIKLGSSILKKERCLPISQDKDCAACHERCPTGAIAMVPHKNLRKPELKDDYCIGCGACEAACPVQSEKAIVVRPKRLHTFAFIPRKSAGDAKLSDIKSAADEGFAF